MKLFTLWLSIFLLANNKNLVRNTQEPASLTLNDHEEIGAWCDESITEENHHVFTHTPHNLIGT
ncbi:MAG TPA: hypothetical protein VLX29_00255, partial [Nitrospirota bacterium]|nr:hypothetical protein [Nitrospirota bacterium]